MTKTKMTISLSENVAKDFTRLLKDSGLTKSGLVTVLVRDEIKRKGEKK